MVNSPMRQPAPFRGADGLSLGRGNRERPATEQEVGASEYRLPPHNMEAEQGLLGAILVHPGAYNHVSDLLLPEHFADAAHGRIYGAASKLIERGQLANPITLKAIFDQDDALADVGGSRYLAELAGAAITIINARAYGREIYDGYLRRQLISIGTDVVNDAYLHDLDAPAHEQILFAEKKLYDLATIGRSEGGFKAFDEALTEAVLMAEVAFKRSGKTAGVATGLIDLDKMLGGLHPSDLLILAGRPSMGKTALATNMAFSAAKAYKAGRDEHGHVKAEDGAVVGFFSLEMSAEQLATRILSEESGVPSDKIRRGEVGHAEFDSFLEASHRLSTVPIFIDDTPGLSIAALRTRARRLKRQHGLDFIVVDYLQLMQSGNPRGSENRVQELSEITRGLKGIAKELNVPVLALSQLSRAVEQREDKRPQLADLRESGSIEQDADVVMFVFREEYYLGRSEPAQRPDESPDKFNARYESWRNLLEEKHGLAEVIIAKQRHGPIGSVRLQFEGRITKFGNLASADHLPSRTS